MPEKKKESVFLERIGDRYFLVLSKRRGKVTGEDEVYLLNPHEQKELRKIERAVIIRAAITGLISGLLCAFASLFSWPLLGDDPDHPSTKQWLLFFIVVNVISILVSILEIMWLYFDSLRSVHKLASVAGLDLYPMEGEANAVRQSLIRAALEIPNPISVEESINPLRETSKAKILIVSTAYKLKVTASSVIFKTLVRRVGGRVIARKYLDFFGLPVYAAWDAVTIWRVMREARIRAMGPSAIEVLLNSAMGETELSEEGKLALLQATGASIVSTADLHPNHITLLHSLFRRTGLPREVEIDNSAAFLKALGKLCPEEKLIALQVLAIAVAIDGRIAPREKDLYLKARKICGIHEDLDYLKMLRVHFRRGMPAQEIPFK